MAPEKIWPRLFLNTWFHLKDDIMQLYLRIDQFYYVLSFLQLQFLFELPNRMKKCIEMKQFVLAVRLVILLKVCV